MLPEKIDDIEQLPALALRTIQPGKVDIIASRLPDVDPHAQTLTPYGRSRFRQTVPRGFVAPVGDGPADLFCDFAGLAAAQIEIPRDRKGQRERRYSLIAALRMRGLISVGTGEVPRGAG